MKPIYNKEKGIYKSNDKLSNIITNIINSEAFNKQLRTKKLRGVAQ